MVIIFGLGKTKRPHLREGFVTAWVHIPCQLTLAGLTDPGTVSTDGIESTERVQGYLYPRRNAQGQF